MHVRLLTLSVLLLSWTTAQAAETRTALQQAIDRFAEPLDRAGHLSGTLLVAKGETVLYERAWGMADYELKAPNTTSTRFNTASVTKPMTQIIAVRMIDQKLLGPGDVVSKWIPDFPRGDVITVEMLLRHRAGIPHRVTEDADEAAPLSAEDIVEFAKKKELLFEPGTSETYSSAGYSLLARVLELAGGKSYDELLEEHVFGPAGAVHSVHPIGRELIDRRARGFFHGGDEPIAAPLRHLSFLVGAGSVFSTPRDLFLIARTLLDGGYGQAARTSLLRDKGLRWNGISNGYRAFLDHDIESDTTIVFAGNLFTGAADLLRRNVPLLVKGSNVERPQIPVVDAKPVAEQQRRSIEGAYLLGGSPVELQFESERRAALGDWILLPVGEDRFFSPQDYAFVVVKRGQSGVVEGLQWGDPGPFFKRAN